MAKSYLWQQTRQTDKSKQTVEVCWQKPELSFVRQLQPDAIFPAFKGLKKRFGRTPAA